MEALEWVRTKETAGHLPLLPWLEQCLGTPALAPCLCGHACPPAALLLVHSLQVFWDPALHSPSTPPAFSSCYLDASQAPFPLTVCLYNNPQPGRLTAMVK